MKNQASDKVKARNDSILDMFRLDISNFDNPTFEGMRMVAGYRITLYQARTGIMPDYEDWYRDFIEAAGTKFSGIAGMAFNSAWHSVLGSAFPESSAPKEPEKPPVEMLDVESCLIEIEAITEAFQYSLSELHQSITENKQLCGLKGNASVLSGLNIGLTGVVDRYRKLLGV